MIGLVLDIQEGNTLILKYILWYMKYIGNSKLLAFFYSPTLESTSTNKRKHANSDSIPLKR
jgi:hypothetical protein